MPWRQKKSKESQSEKTREKPFWYIHVPTDRETKALSTGTSSRKLAKRMESMVEDLYRGERRDPAILQWLVDRSLPTDQRLKPLTLLHYYDNNKIDALKQERAQRNAAALVVAEVDVNDHVDAWYKNVMARSTKDHADRFRDAVRTFVTEGTTCPPSRFDYLTLLDWTNSLTDDGDDGFGLGAETARRYRVGMLNFIDHLVMSGVLMGNALATISPPKKSKPRDRHLLTGDAIRLVEAFADQSDEAYAHLIAVQGLRVLDLQGFNALIAGAGVEVSVSLALTVGDVRLRDKEVRAPGTKTHSRDRVVRVAEWAWPWVLACAEGRPKHEKLFETIRDRWVANHAFLAAIAPLVKAQPLVFGGYWLRDGRHTYAVRAIKAGTPAKVVSVQLGHANPDLVNRVYGVYAPSSKERDHWENMAAARDREHDDVAIPVVVKAATQEGAVARVAPHVRRRASKIEWPTKEQLLDRLRTSSVLTIAKELGVSPTAVSKHLHRHGVATIPDGRRSAASRPRRAANEMRTSAPQTAPLRIKETQ